MSRIFLSHSSANNASAIALRDWLISEGWDDLFLDLDPKRGIGAGERWERALIDAAHRCEAVLFFVSRSWLASHWCMKEFNLATRLNKRMFGVLIEDLPVNTLPAELTATWQLVNLAAGSDHRVFRAVAASEPEAHVTFSKEGLQRLKAGLTKAGLDPRFFEWPPARDPDRPPYRGLRPLEAEDAGIFFGREAPIIETLDRLRGLRLAPPPRLLAILGASGAGKSSFLRAGLLPRLRRDDRSFLVLPVIRPERAVLWGETGLLRSLEQALESRGLKHTRAELKKTISAGAEQLLTILASLATKAAGPKLADETSPQTPTLILAIDQGEELFQSDGTEEAHTFLTLLRDVLSQRSTDLIVIFTIRSDSYEYLQTSTALEGLRQQTMSLPPLPKGTYQAVIEGPVERLKDTSRALKVEPALTEALLSDIESGGAKDALPLLAFTLERLYLEHGGDGDLRLSEYRDIGGMGGSIEAAIEQAFKAADSDAAIPKDRAARLVLLRRAFIPWLAGIDPATGSPRRAIARLTEIPPEARPLVRHLVDQRLLSTDRSPSGEQTIEPAHEALLRQWSMLDGWLKEDFAQLSTLEGVKRATRDWLANDKAPDWLAHNAGRLEDAEALNTRPDLAAKLGSTEQDYLRSCRTAETERRDRELAEARKLADAQRKISGRTRLGLIAASILSVIALLAALYGLQQAGMAREEARRAEDQTEKAETALRAGTIQESNRIAALANELADQGKIRLPMALALQAVAQTGAEDKPVITPSITTLMTRLARTDRTIETKRVGGNVFAIAVSKDERQIFTGTAKGELQFWDMPGLTLRYRRKAFEGLVAGIEVSPDQKSLLVAGDFSSVWDTQNATKRFDLPNPDSGTSTSASFTPDGAHIVVGTNRNHVYVYKADDGRLVTTITGPDYETSVLAMKAKARANGNDDDTLGINAGLARLLSTMSGSTSDIAISPDGKTVAVAGVGDPERAVRLYSLPSGAFLRKMEGMQYGSGVMTFARRLRFTRDGKVLFFIATGRLRAQIQRFDVSSGTLLSALLVPTVEPTALVSDDEGKTLITGHSDGSIVLWCAAEGRLVNILRHHKDRISDLALSPAGDVVVSTSWDGSAALWAMPTPQQACPQRTDDAGNAELATINPLASLDGHSAMVHHAVILPTYDEILTISLDGGLGRWRLHDRGLTILNANADPIPDNSYWFSSDELAFFDSGRKIVMLPGRGDITAWDTPTGKKTNAFDRGQLAKSPSSDELLLFQNPFQPSVLVPSPAQREPAATVSPIRARYTPFGSFTMSPDGSRTVADPVWVDYFANRSPINKKPGTADLPSYLLDTTTGKLLAAMVIGDKAVTLTEFTKDGSRLVALLRSKDSDISKQNEAIVVWDSRTGHFITQAPVAKSIRSLLASRDGQIVVAIQGDEMGRPKTPLFFGLEDDTLQAFELPIPSEITKNLAMRSVALSDDGRIFAAGTEQGSIILWDIPARKMMTSINAAAADILRLAISKAGDKVAATDEFGRVYVFDLLNLDVRTRLTNLIDTTGGRITALKFADKGDRLAVALEDQSIRVISLDPLEFRNPDRLSLVDWIRSRHVAGASPDEKLKYGITDAAMQERSDRALLAAIATGEPQQQTAPAVIAECDKLTADPFDQNRRAPGTDTIDVKSAELACNRALADNPQDATTLYQMGRVLFQLDKPDEARMMLRRAADKNYPIALARLALQLHLNPKLPRTALGEPDELMARAAQSGDLQAVLWTNADRVRQGDTAAIALTIRSAVSTGRTDTVGAALLAARASDRYYFGRVMPLLYYQLAVALSVGIDPTDNTALKQRNTAIARIQAMAANIPSDVMVSVFRKAHAWRMPAEPN